MSDRQRVAVITGGGGGIGAAIAEELGRRGSFVVTMDPLVSVDGSEQLPLAEETTAGRIVAAGGSARASSVSVTDADGVRELFEELVAERGGLDAVVNVAGITRPTSFTKGTEDDWLSVLEVHLDGYLNILNAALPLMAAAGHGRILGVTSGSGWRPANTGAYGCAKRAVAALTWQLGRHAPPGVVVNAMSPIAATRMVTAALSRARPASESRGAATSASGGLSLASMPTPDELGPLGAHLVSDGFSWCSGQVVFAGGSEIAVIDPPRLLEAVRADDVSSLAHVLDAVTPRALVPAEVNQATNGGSNARFAAAFEDSADDAPTTSAARSCVVISDLPELRAALAASLEPRGVTCTGVDPGPASLSFHGATDALAAAAAEVGPLDAVVIALAGATGTAAASRSRWEQTLAEHTGIVAGIHADATWARAVADYAAAAERPVRMVSLTDATTTGGRSRGQALAQHARAARSATKEGMVAFPISVEAAWIDAEPVITQLVSHLLCTTDVLDLSGAELVADAGWFGLFSHPHPIGSITFGGPGVPRWFDATLRRMVGHDV